MVDEDHVGKELGKLVIYGSIGLFAAATIYDAIQGNYDCLAEGTLAGIFYGASEAVKKY